MNSSTKSKFDEKNQVGNKRYCTDDMFHERKKSKIEYYSCVAKLSSFDKMIKYEIEKLDKTREIQKKFLNYAIKNFISSINLRKELIVFKIDNFFDHQKLQLTQALSDIRQLRELRPRSFDPELRENYENMAAQLINSTGRLMNRIRKLGLKNEYDPVKFEELNNLPIKEYTFLLNYRLKKVIATRLGFFGWLANNEIVDLIHGKPIVTDTNYIIDVCVTYDNNLAYIIKQNTKFCFKIMNFDKTWMEKSFEDPFDNSSKIAIGIFKRNAVISSGSQETMVFCRSDFKASSYDKKIIEYKELKNHKAYPDGMVIDYGDYIEYYNDKKSECVILKLKSYRSSYHLCLYKDMINKLIKGHKLITYNDYFAIINIKLKEGLKIQHRKIFPGKKLLDFNIKDNEIIFCLRDEINKQLLMFQHFPLRNSFYKR